jgi:lysophospholipase L1-like esterase
MLPRLFSCLIAFTTPLLADEASPAAKWEKEIAALEAKAKNQPPVKGSIVFIGSSSIRLWSTLAADFPKHHVCNHGFGGSQIADSTHFAERLIFPHEPRLIVMYAGGNDINAGHTAEQVAADFRAFVEKVRTRLPQVEIAYISIAGNPARWKQIETVKTANRLIAEFCAADTKLKFIDVFPHMLGPDGLPKPEIFREDRLHMNDVGYRLWTSVIGPHLGPPDKP